MKPIARLSIVHIAISLAYPIWTALYRIPFVQLERAQVAAGEIHDMFSYENFVQEAGFGRLAISTVALLILLIPFRRAERWAFAAWVILAIAYYVPVFLFNAIPNLGTWPLFRIWTLPRSRVTNFALEYWSPILFIFFLVLGLAMSAPAFLGRKGH
jgi:hypothetical protein